MNKLKWWMRIVGVLYLLLGVITLPSISMPTQTRMEQFPELATLTGTIAFELLVETWFMLGLEMAVIGAMLLYAARDPAKNVILAQTVIGLELIRGIAYDIYVIAQGYPAGYYIGFILFHLLIIIPGVIFLREKEADGGLAEARGAIAALNTNSDAYVPPVCTLSLAFWGMQG